MNGKPLEAFAAPNSYLVIDRTWRTGDTVRVSLPMKLRAEPTPDDATVQAVMYGPIVLAGRLGTEGLTVATLRAPPTKPRMVPEFPPNSAIAAPTLDTRAIDSNAWMTRNAPLEFRTTGQKQDVVLAPLYKIMDERYAVYWKTV